MKNENDVSSTPFTAETESFRDILSKIDDAFHRGGENLSEWWQHYSPLNAIANGLQSLEHNILNLFPLEKAFRSFSIFSVISLVSMPIWGGSRFFQGNLLRSLVDVVFLLATLAALISISLFIHREYTAYQNRVLERKRREYFAKRRACRRNKPVKHLHRLDENEKILVKSSADRNS